MFDLLIQNVLADETTNAAAAAAQGQPSPLTSMVPFVLIFVVFYFLMIRPQKKKMQEEQSMLNTLGKGDEVYTKSGMIGIIHGLNEKVVTLEVSEGVRLKVLRGQIGGLAKKLFEKPEASAPVQKKKK